MLRHKMILLGFILLLLLWYCTKPNKNSDQDEPTAPNILTYGGEREDNGVFIQQAPDSGFILTGSSNSFHVEDDYDLYLVKTDKNGQKIWEKTYGSSNSEEGICAYPVENNNIIILGDIIDDRNHDMLLIKVDSLGIVIWEKTYPGIRYNTSFLIPTSDNDYILVYSSQKTAGCGEYGCWKKYFIDIIKVDKDGNQMWANVIGDSGSDYYSRYIASTADNGYIITGEADGHCCLIKADNQGNQEWMQTYYGESGRCVQVSSDEGYIITAYGGVPDVNYIIKTDIYGNLEWHRRLTGAYNLRTAYNIIPEGGYIYAGFEIDNGTIDIIKVDPNFNEDWKKSFSGEFYGTPYLEKTNDNCWVVTGTTRELGDGLSYNVFLIKVDITGNVLM